MVKVVNVSAGTQISPHFRYRACAGGTESDASAPFKIGLIDLLRFVIMGCKHLLPCCNNASEPLDTKNELPAVNLIYRMFGLLLKSYHRGFVPTRGAGFPLRIRQWGEYLSNQLRSL